MRALTFVEMLREVRDGLEIEQQKLANDLGFSSQYLCDLEKGRRLPTVKFIDKICDYLSRGPAGRKAWHLAGARAHGWKI